MTKTKKVSDRILDKALDLAKESSWERVRLQQVADALAGAIWAAFEPKYGVTEESHLLRLGQRLYRRNDKVWGYGLKFIPHEADQVPLALMPASEWLSRL